jgi:hypothetical protein
LEVICDVTKGMLSKECVNSIVRYPLISTASVFLGI